MNKSSLFFRAVSVASALVLSLSTALVPGYSSLPAGITYDASLSQGTASSGSVLESVSNFQTEQSHLSADPSYIHDHVILTWDPDVTEGHTSLLGSVTDGFGAFPDYDDSSFTFVTLKDPAQYDEFASAVLSVPGIMAVEPDSTITSASLTNDYFSDSQWALSNLGIYSHIEGSLRGNLLSKSDIDIDASEGWTLYGMLENEKIPVTVAIIDTGIDFNHPDLADSCWTNEGEIPGNGIDDDGNGYVDDVNGWDFYNNDNTVCHYKYNDVYQEYLADPSDNDDHGTHIAGIIAATANNTIGIAGVASCADVKLMSLKVNGGPARSGIVAHAISAIQYADRMGASVCNMSWCSDTDSAALQTAIERSHMLFVCAAGNSGTNNDVSPVYPACYDLPNLISVTDIDANGGLTYSSNYGASSVDIVAPGTDIFSTCVGSYRSLSGSSMSAGHVTGLAAVIFTLGTGIYPSEVKDLITGNIKTLPDLEGLIKYPGIPSLGLMLDCASDIIYDTAAPDFTIKREFDGDSIIVSLEAYDVGGSGPRYFRYFFGSHDISEFEGGTAGTVISDGRLALSKPGLYTFYLSDWSGNASARTVYIVDDMLPPVIGKAKLSVNKSQTRITVTVPVSDSTSGIKTAKYLSGRHTVNDFLNDGRVLPVVSGNTIGFQTSEEGVFTVYACDMRGNKTVSYVYAYIRHATAVTLDTDLLLLEPGDAYQLSASLTPASSTDTLSFTSSDISVVFVDSRGKLLAEAPGEAYVTVTSASGPSAVCHVIVE